MGGAAAAATMPWAILYTHGDATDGTEQNTTVAVKTMPLAAPDAIRVRTTTVYVPADDADHKAMAALEQTRTRALSDRARRNAEEEKQRKRILERKSALE